MKKPRHQNAEAVPFRHDLPEDWDFKSRRAKIIGCNHISKIGGVPQYLPYGLRIRVLKLSRNE